MKLRELLTEVELLTDINKTDKRWADGHSYVGQKVKTKSFGNAMIANGAVAGGTWHLIDTEHHDYNGNMNEYRYMLMSKDSADKVQCVATLAKHGAAYKVGHLVGKDKSTIPANKMYAAFVKKGNILTSSSQSEGGLRVWQKLSKEPGILVHGWNTRSRQPVNLGPSFDDTSDTHSNVDIMYDVDEKDKKQRKYEYDVEHNVILVATKKK